MKMTRQSQPEDLTSFIIDKIGVTGRQGLLRDWSELIKLFQKKILPIISTEEIESMLGKKPDEMNPELNDYKAMVAYGVRAGWVTATEFREALLAANQSNPLWFLATRSGKTFGETVAPLVAEYFLKKEKDIWRKMPATKLYDIEWTPVSKEMQRIELKASSEEEPRFQQIRPPRMSGNKEYDYDGLLCLGVYGGTFEWWYLPAKVLEELIKGVVITQQHNAGKDKTDSLWVTVDTRTRSILESYYMRDSNSLRAKILKIINGK